MSITSVSLVLLLIGIVAACITNHPADDGSAIALTVFGLFDFFMLSVIVTMLHMIWAD